MAQFRLASVLTAAAVAAATMVPPAFAQQGGQNPGWFVPNQRPSGGGAPRPQPRPQPHTEPQVQPNVGEPFPGGDAASGVPQQIQVQLPPAPEVPTLAKGETPPAAVIGVISIPDVLRISTAYQAADKELGTRRQKLNEDAQKEQVALRELGQTFANERAKLSPDQIRNKERDYQNRVNDSRRKFAERNRIIQEAGQYAMAQIDRTLEQVAQAVAVSRGVNLVLNRAQLLGTTAEFDLTARVAEVLNQVLPSVLIPPDGVSPVAMKVPGADGKPAAAPPAAADTKTPKKN